MEHTITGWDDLVAAGVRYKDGAIKFPPGVYHLTVPIELPEQELSAYYGDTSRWEIEGSTTPSAARGEQSQG